MTYPAPKSVFKETLVQAKVAALKRMLEVLRGMPQPHLQFSLLKGCLDGCKLSFLARVCPIAGAAQEFSKASNMIRETLGTIIGAPLTNDQWRQATLPVRLAGMGIRDPLILREHARLAAIIGYLSVGPENLGLPLDLPMGPEDTMTVVTRLRGMMGPSFNP